MLLLSTIDLKIPIPVPDQKISLCAVAVRKSMTAKVPVFCKCKKNAAGALPGDALM